MNGTNLGERSASKLIPSTNEYKDNLGKVIKTRILSKSKKLINTIKKLQLYKPSNLLNVVYLFYDDFNGNIEINKLFV